MYKPTRELLKRLPKTDLHVHLDGSLRLQTILDLAAEQKVRLPTEDKDKLWALISADNAKSLTDYLRAFDITLSVMQTEESLYRAAYELCQDAAAENVWYMEVRYSPMLHMKRGLPLTFASVLATGLGEFER